MARARVLILWNQLDDDVVELWRRDGRRSPDWDPNLIVEPWDTVAEEIEQIVECVREAGYDAKAVNIRDNFETLMDTVRSERADVVMNLIEWFHDDLEHETHVPAMFELLNQSYTGNRPLALSLCQKKPQAKSLLAAAGLPVPRGLLVDLKMGRAPDDLALNYPLIVKPAFDDASGGIDAGSVVRDRASLDKRVELVVGAHKMPALIEEFIEGREIHCAILGNSPPTPLPLYEMRFKPNGVDNEGRPLPNIITYRAKWDPYSRDYYAMESKCPVDDLGDDLSARIQAVAVRAYLALGCRDYARVDMRLDAQGNPYILEVNPNPDLADGCAFAQCVRASGRTYAQAIQEIVGYALDRARNKPQREPAPSENLLREYVAQRSGGRSTR
ncbi:MAG: ATP-grasp domain-containing protein [Kofleriaceae bacterium]|nr:ATP-grasp domain-containing protein [Kofleriaceae bacterium]